MLEVNAKKTNLPKETRPDVNLEHHHNYIGGAFAYKNSKKRRDLTDPKSRAASVLITGYGRARPVDVIKRVEDGRVGIYPDHNSPEDFQEEIEILPAKSLDIYKEINDVENLRAKGFKQKTVSLTKDRVNKIYEQFSHLSIYAFNQMMCITTPDKRDFKIWCKEIKKSKQIIIAYPHTKTNLTQFVQVLQKNDSGEVVGIKHCLYDKGEPFVVNESAIDKFGNLRQLAHVGSKDASLIKNVVERFDDGTVTWTVTNGEDSGTAALKENGEIIVIGAELNNANMLAARNLGGEGLNEDGTWSGSFSLQACLAESHEKYKASVRKQIGQIVDGAAIPGLKPIFEI